MKGKTLWSNRSDSRQVFTCVMVSVGRLPYEKGRDARLKFQIKPLGETNLGVAHVFLTPRRDHIKTRIYKKYRLLIMPKTLSSNTFTYVRKRKSLNIHFYISSRATLKETFTATYDCFLPRTPQVRPKSKIYTSKRDDEHPSPFYVGVNPLTSS